MLAESELHTGPAGDAVATLLRDNCNRIQFGVLPVIEVLGRWPQNVHLDAEIGSAHDRYDFLSKNVSRLAAECAAQQVLDSALAFHQVSKMILGAPRSISEIGRASCRERV